MQVATCYSITVILSSGRSVHPYHGVVKVCADLINIIAPLEQVLAQQNHLISAHAKLEIVRGCDGAGVLFLVISAILVFPASLRRKLLGLLFGVSLIYGINLLRIGALYFVVAYQPDYFSLIHTYLAPTFWSLPLVPILHGGLSDQRIRAMKA